MFFERETLNPNNNKYFLKTIGYNKLKYAIDSSTTIATANLISLDNIGPRVKSHFQLPSSLILWSCRKNISLVKYYNHGGLRQQNRKSSPHFNVLTDESVS